MLLLSAASLTGQITRTTFKALPSAFPCFHCEAGVRTSTTIE